MNSFRYKGPAVNLGRFGPVKSGEVLHLTEREAESVQKDKRFTPVTAEVPEEKKDAVHKQEVSEMNREDLVVYCRALQAVDPTFMFREDSEHTVLLAQVRQRMEQQAKNPA